MMNVQSDTVLLALLLLVLTAVVGMALLGRGVPSRGRSFVFLGLGLLVMGDLLYFANRGFAVGPPSIFGDSRAGTWIQQIVFLRGGLIMLAVGLLRMAPQIVAIERSKRLLASAVETDTKLQFVRGLMDSIVKSSIGGTIVLRAVREVGVGIVDFEFVLVNPAAEQILGRASETLIDKKLCEEFPCIDKYGLLDDARGAMASGLPYNGELHRPDEQGGRWYQIAAVRHGSCLVATVIDITQQRRIEQQLRYTAEHDALTGLANRALLRERLDDALVRCRSRSSYSFAVLFLDFDRFKLINDGLGHEVGDQLLISIADRLRANLRAIDSSPAVNPGHFAARLGGDEFVVFLDDIKEVCNASIIGQRLLADLNAPHRIAGNEITSTASIGIVTSDRDYARADDILRDADTAMYEAKKSGKACVVSFSDDMYQSARSKLQVEAQLRDAVRKGAIFLEYQPIVSLHTGDIVGAEALIRWSHPQRGIVPPDDFIGLAEELGIVIPLGDLVLRQACAAIGAWSEHFPDGIPITTNVNVSKTELAHPQLIEMIQQVLDETGIDPSTLGLEITESTVMDDLERVLPVLEQLKQLGVTLYMDDFGTGHSSLSCLDRVPFDVLKIDKSFVHSARDKRQYAAIIHAIICLAHNLEMPVIGEGIENDDHLTLLQGLDCDRGQGWMFGEPVSADEFGRMLFEGRWKAAA